MTLTERREKLMMEWRTALVNVQAAEQQLNTCKARVTGLEAQVALVTELLAETNGSAPAVELSPVQDTPP